MKERTNCDICNKEFIQEDLINIDPQQTGELNDLKEEYENFDGMVCNECYLTIAKDNKAANSCLIINGIETNSIEFAYDRCHKIYLIETIDDRIMALDNGYDILPIGLLEETFNDSCSLKFISNWNLDKRFVKQFEDAHFDYRQLSINY